MSILNFLSACLVFTFSCSSFVGFTLSPLLIPFFLYLLVKYLSISIVFPALLPSLRMAYIYLSVGSLILLSSVKTGCLPVKFLDFVPYIAYNFYSISKLYSLAPMVFPHRRRFYFFMFPAALLCGLRHTHKPVCTALCNRSPCSCIICCPCKIRSYAALRNRSPPSPVAFPHIPDAV